MWCIGALLLVSVIGLSGRADNARKRQLVVETMREDASGSPGITWNSADLSGDVVHGRVERIAALVPILDRPAPGARRQSLLRSDRGGRRRRGRDGRDDRGPRRDRSGLARGRGDESLVPTWRQRVRSSEAARSCGRLLPPRVSAGGPGGQRCVGCPDARASHRLLLRAVPVDERAQAGRGAVDRQAGTPRAEPVGCDDRCAHGHGEPAQAVRRHRSASRDSRRGKQRLARDLRSQWLQELQRQLRASGRGRVARASRAPADRGDGRPGDGLPDGRRRVLRGDRCIGRRERPRRSRDRPDRAGGALLDHLLLRRRDHPVRGSPAWSRHSRSRTDGCTAARS